jgi:hypothetical protein
MSNGRRSVFVVIGFFALAGDGLCWAEATSAGGGDSSVVQAGNTSAGYLGFRGTWEGFTSDQLRYFMVEIGQVRHRWRVAMVASDVHVFGVDNIQVRGDRVELVCSGRGEAWNLRLRVVGRGWSGGDEDKLRAKMTLTDAMGRVTHGSWSVNLMTCKGGCAERLLSMKVLAQKAMAEINNELHR